MKRILVSLALLAYITSASFAQDYFIPFGNKKSEAVVLQNNISNVNMLFSLQGIYGKEVLNTKGQNFTELYFGKGYSSGDLGAPKLPAFKKLIQIPHGATVKLNVVGYTEQEFTLSEYGIVNKVYPVQPSLRKDQDIEKEPFFFNEKIYSNSQYQNQPIANIEVLGTMRGVRIARVEVYPVNYNPVSGSIKAYNDIEVEISFEGANKALDQEILAKTRSPYFEPIYSILANSNSKNSFDTHPDLVEYPVRMLIVSHRMFEATLAPFVEWKTKKGFSVEVAYTDIIGTTSNAIKTYIHGKYNNSTPVNPAPSFIVLVGDVAQVPSSATGSSSGKQTDLYYASVDGDYFPEMYYGRLSAQTTTQLENIINKILYHEQYQFADPTYLNNATFIAGVDGNWNPKVGQPAIKYATANYYNSAHDFNTVWGYGITSDPNNPNNNTGYTGCYDNARISVSLINYTAHCNETLWGDPQLTISNVNAMTNTNKYPLAVGNCCLAADFGTSECIGEAWIRGANKGAVTYIGSSPSSYWFEDFYWAVGAFPLQGNNDGYVPTFAETTLGAYDAPFASDYITTGGLIFVGNLAVTEVDIQNYPSHSSPLYYWQAYNVLGDPSLVPFLTEGQANTVSHMAIVPIGLDTYTVNALPGSYVAISKGGVLHGAALVDASGEVEVSIEPIVDGGNVDIVVTRPQTIPYIVQVPATALEGPYIVLDTYVVNDAAGNNNQAVDFGEAFTLHVTLKNVGADPGVAINATLSGTDEYFTITDGDAVSFGNIANGETGNTATANNAFALTVANNVPDQYQASFVIQITDGTDTWQSNLKIKANAPFLKYGTLSLDDTGSGDSDGILDPGETADLTLTLSNTGHAAVSDLTGLLTTANPNLTIVNGTFPVASLAAGASTSLVYTVTADASTPLGTSVNLTASATAGEYSATGAYEVIIGFVPVYCASGATSTSYSDLTGFTFGPLENTTPVGGTYDDFTQVPSLVHEYMLGATYDVSVTLGDANNASYPKGAKVFVDWNYDGDFTDAGETAFTVTPQNANWTATGTITIPADAPLGQKYLRVVVMETSSLSNINPCGTFSWGGTEDYRIILVAPEAPVTDFTATPLVTVENDVVVFTDLTTNAPTAWSWTITPGVEGTDWTFVESTSATSRHPRVQFISPNTYTVALEASNMVGSVTETKTDYITINELTEVPVAGFSVSSAEVYPGVAVQLTDASTNLPISWAWTITPGVQGTDWSYASGTNAGSKNPVVTFSTPGYYSITLVATNPVGASAPYTQEDAVHVLEVYLMQTGTITTCSGAFFDTGGPNGAYSNNSNLTLTILPTVQGDKVKVTFSMVNLESYDQLQVFDGQNATATLLATISGTNVPNPIVATNASGALTFKFTSNGSVTRDGWAGTFGCVTPIPSYSVSFAVVDANAAPIAGAWVALTGHGSRRTNTQGIAIFPEIDAVQGLAYTVTNSGYQAASGTVDVVDSDVTVEVMLNITGAPVNLSDGVRVYPNPFGPQLTLEGVAHVRQVEVISLIGQRVLLMESHGGETLTLPTDHLQPGVYMIRLTGEHGMQSLIKVVKQ